jgi:hypothetical protein
MRTERRSIFSGGPRAITVFLIVSGLCSSALAFVFYMGGAPSIPSVENQIILQPIYRIYYSTPGSFMTRTEYLSGYTEYGSSGYIAASTATGRTPLIRYWSSSASAYQDDNTPPGGDYVVHGALEYAFSTNNGDRVALKKYTNGSKFVTVNENQAPPGLYTAFSEDLGYAYERYAMNLTSFMTLTSGKMQLKFDRVCGGALWNIVYDHDSLGEKQLVNNYYYGRQVCTALDLWAASGLRHIPSDCGQTAAVSTWFTDPNVRMGSPVPVWQKVYPAAGVQRAIIETVPVENSVPTWTALGGTSLNPVLYPDMRIRKEVTTGILGMDETFKWEVQWRVDSLDSVTNNRINITGAHWCGFMEKLYLYNPVTQTTTNISNWHTSTNNLQFKKYYSSDPAKLQFGAYMQDYTCVISTDANDDYAVGIMGCSPDIGGSVDYMLGYNWKELEGGFNETEEYMNRTVMMTPMRTNALASAQWTASTVYFVVGTLDECKVQALNLYSNRSNLAW